MQPPDLAQYIHRQIPLSKAMGISVVSVAADAVTLQAPLEPTLNHRQTVFGGSASALAILASWSLLHVRLNSEGIAARLVIQRNTMEYEHPILGEFTARSMLEHPESWKPFTALLARRGRATITVLAVLEHMGRVAGRFSGQFVAFSNDRKSGA